MKITKFIQVLIAVTVAVGLWGFFFADEVVTLAEALDGHCVANCGGGGSSGGSNPGGSGGGWSAPRSSSPAELARQRREDEGVAANDKGVKYAKMGDYDTAIKYYEESLRISPNNSTTRGNMGIALNKKGLEYYDSGDFDKTIQYLEQALRYKPNDQVIKANLRDAKASQDNAIGIEYFNKEDFEGALQSFKQALQRSPDDTTIQKNVRDAEAELKGQREKQAKERELAESKKREKQEKERKLAESKIKVKQMLDNMSEEFDSSTPPTDSLGFMSPDKPLVAKDSLSFMSPDELVVDQSDLRDAPNAITDKKALKEYSNVRDHSYKTLEQREVPLPELGLKVSQKPIKIEEGDSGIWEEMKGRLDDLTDKASEWIDEKKDELKVWTYGETYDKTIGRVFRGAKEVKDFKEGVEEGIKDMKGIVDEPYSHVQKGMQQGPGNLADPDAGGELEKKYNEGIQGAGERAIDKTNKMRDKNI